MANKLIHHGADRVVTVEHPHLKSYTSDGFGQAFMAVYRQEKPEAIVFGHTALGKDLSPKIASKLSSGLISDVTDIEGEGADAEFIRPIYSGKAFEKVKNKDGLLFITIRPNNIAASHMMLVAQEMFRPLLSILRISGLLLRK